MSNVAVSTNKTFSQADEEIISRFVEFLEALVEGDLEKLDEIVLEEFEFKGISGKSQSKEEFLSEIDNGTLDYSTSEILDPTVLFDGDTASLMANVRITTKLREMDRRWISNSAANFQKIDDEWCLSDWNI